MKLSDLIAKQIDADVRRGFEVSFETDQERHDQLMRDLVGLVSEVGEFADHLKKVGLTYSTPGYAGSTLEEARERLCFELADIAIYLFRLCKVLDCDLERTILKKMAVNDSRYSYLEK